MGKKNTPKRNGFNTQKIFKYVRIGALVLPAATIALGSGTPAQKLARVKADYFGVDAAGSFSFGRLAKGWTPFLASVLVTYGIPKIAGMIRGF